MVTAIGPDQHNTGLLGGEGMLNGDVAANTATLGPGHPVGTLAVKGDFTVGSESVLEIEIGGPSAGEFDTLQVVQNAYLNGTLAVTLTDNYYPNLGEQFSILEAGSIANYGITLDGPDADKFKMVFTTGQLLLESTMAGLPGDYNGNGLVDAADYTLWRNTLGQTGVNLAADGNRDGVVNQVDYDYWKIRFGDSTGGNGSSNIPEPVAWVIMIQLAVIWTLVSRNRC